MKIGATTTAAFGVGPWVPVIGDFPLAWGLLSIQGLKERSSDDAPPTAPGRRRVRVAEGLGCNFVFLWGPDLISSYFMRKKKASENLVVIWLKKQINPQ
jgi:hypothetical protein